VFGPLDWAVTGAYFALVTVVGHLSSRRGSTLNEYLLASRSLPWPAVSASIVATTVSGVTFIGVPALVFAQGGDFRYLQFTVAGVIAKAALGYWILPRMYAGEFSSPYQFIRAQLGPRLGGASALLFFVGAVLGQGVRVFAVALVLELLTGLDMELCVLVIVVFSTLHTWMGGIRAVVWTDAIQFVVLVAGGLLAIAFVAQGGAGGFGAVLEAGSEAGKLRTFDFTADPRVQFTFWAGVFAMPFQNLAAYGSDQINIQRMLCCRNLRDARVALYVSNFGELVVVLFLCVGLSLWWFYGHHPLDGSFAALVAERADRIFPAFILTELPAGVKGLMVAGVFAAAMSSLDSVLAALSQVTLTMFHKGHLTGELTDARAVTLSRIFVAVWGVILGAFALLVSGSGEALVPLAFAMTAYTYGPMLGLLLLALFVPVKRIGSATLGVVVSMVGVLLVHNAKNFGFTDGTDLVAFPWLFPLGVLLCLGTALLPWGRRAT